MKEFFQKNKVTLLIIGGTVILAGIAIFTAIRLYNLRQESVSPAAPESKPAAQEAPEEEEAPEIAEEGQCLLSFQLTDEGGVTCTEKKAFLNGQELLSGDTVNPGDTIEYQLNLENTALSDAIGEIVDEIDSQTIFVDGHDSCEFNSDDHTITCTTDTLTPSTTGTLSYQVQIDSSATEGTITNTATITNPVNELSTTCSIDLTVELVPSPSPSPSPTPTPTPTPTPPSSCNNSCDASSDCVTGLVCSGGLCRNPSCTNEVDCTCPLATPTPSPTPPPALPEAGVGVPTIIGGAAGVILLLGALLLAL